MKKSILTILLPFIIAILLVPLTAAQAALIGKVTSVEGNVDLTRDSRPAKPVVLDEQVYTGDIIRVKSKGKAEITLIDGNLLRLAANTRMKMTQYRTGEGQKSYFDLFRGKTQAVVNKMSRNSTFEVHTPTAVCGVRGSIFFSSFINGQSSFVFSRGTGYGYNNASPTQIQTLPPKLLMIVPGADKPTILKPVTDTEINVLVKETAPVQKPKDGGQKPQGDSSKQGTGTGGGATSGTGSGEGQSSGSGSTGGSTTGSSQGSGGGSTTVNPTETTTNLTLQQTNIGSTTTTTTSTTTVTQGTTTATVATPPPPTAPPTITFTATPASTTTADSATISYEANQVSSFSYQIDNGPWQSGASSSKTGTTSLTDLPEGARTFRVKAQSSGGESTKTYSWTTDYSSGPTVTSLTPKAAKPVTDGKADIDLQFTPTIQNNAHKYRVDSGSYQTITAGSSSFTATGLSPGSRTIGVYERSQESGKRGSETTTGSFTLSRYDFSGNVWHSSGGLMSDPVSGRIAGISGQSWGSWEIAYQGTGDPSASWNYYAGKANDASGTTASQMYYWLSRGSATSGDGSISGASSELTYLTRSILGTGANGVVSGNYSNGIWRFTDKGVSESGAGLYTETPLAFWGSVKQGEANNFMSWNQGSRTMTQDGSMTGLIGGTTDLWTGSPSFTGLGSYANPNNRTLYQGRFDQSGYDLSNGNFRGNFGGIVKSQTQDDASANVYRTEGFGYAIYIKNPASSGSYETGYLQFSNITGNIFPDVGMWKQTGTVAKTYKGTTAYAPQSIDSYLVYDDTVRQRQVAGSGAGWSLSGYANHKSYYLQGQSWRLWRGESGGDFSGTPTSDWTAVYGGKDTSSGVDVNYEIGKVTGSVWTDEKIAGTVSGKNLSWQTMGTHSGQLLGNVAGAGNWQALTGGVSDSENLKFAALVGKWSSSSRTGASLIYSRSAAPVETITINPSTNSFPIRFNINWTGSTDFDSHAWIAPQGNGNRYYHIYYGNEGLLGYNKFRYPYAYLDNDNTSGGQENIRYYMFQPGRTYYAVHRYSSSVSNPVVNAQIYNGSDTAIGSAYQKYFPDNNYYWNVFRIDSTADPLADVTVYRYDVYGSSTPMDLHERVDSTGSIIGIMGGAQSPIHGATTANIPVRFMGSYSQATEFNRFWGQDLVAYNDSTGKYVTFDDGAFFGVLGGSFRPGEKRVQGTFHTFAVNSAGYAGLLRGSFGTGESSYPGTIYPDISMWEADGKISRFDMNVASGFTPSQLTGQWYAVSGSSTDPFYKSAWQAQNSYIAQTHISSWNSNSGMHEGNWGMFLDGTYTQKARMLDREDYIDLYRLTQDANYTFGVWGWRSLGKYNSANDYANDKWIMDADMGIRTGSSGNKKFVSQLIAYGNAWNSQGNFTGQVVGHLADGELGFTGVMAGDMVGVFNNSPSMLESYEYNTFGAISTGSWIKTQTYLQMIDDATAGGGREKLAALGYPTEEISLAGISKNLTGALASKPEAAYVITGNNLRAFSAPNISLLNIYAAASSSSNPNYTVSLSTGSIYPVTNDNSSLPVYGALRADYASDGTWLGHLNAFGVFQKADSSLIQANLSGPVAGTYTNSGFSGTSSGIFVESTFLSQLTADGKTATLRYYDGTSSGFTPDGRLEGLLGSTNPVEWRQNSAYPIYTELQMAGVWQPDGTPVQRSHVFNFPIYPRNFINSTYTTTTGASFWGYMPGIHQFTGSGSSQDGIEVGLASVFVNGSKAGFLFGRLGGPTALDTTSYYGFDYNNQAFAVDSSSEKAVLVEIGSTQITAAGLKDNISNHSVQYGYSGGVLSASQPEIAGVFTSGGTASSSYIYLEKSNTPITRTLVANSINDATVNGRWGVWSTDLFGAYDANGTSYDNWIMEVKTAGPLQEGDPQPLRRMGAIIQGEKWQNNRLAGDVIGHWANVEAAMTGISFGKLLGTYDPNTTTFQAVAAGGFLETSQYLAMTETSSGRETLRSINVPCVQVGIASLTGSTGDLTVNMNDAKFFAFSTGTAPHVWATNNVNGQFVSTQPLNTTVNLSGSGLTADFTVKNWNTGTNTWMATVTNGQGGITNGGAHVQNLQFRGAAAGNISAPVGGVTAFSGTGSGVVKQAVAY